MRQLRYLSSAYMAATMIAAYTVSTWAGTTGKISGRVIDKQSGDPLVGVNVIIEGTMRGAATDANGYYFLLQVPPGTYAVKAAMIGYEQVTFTNVKVSVDLTTKRDFELGATVLEVTKGVTIVAERPIIEKDVTFSTHRLTEDRLKNMPGVVEVSEVLARQPGVVGEGLHINVRGGRTGEMQYVVDGVSSRDPLHNQASRTTQEQVKQFTSNPVDELASRSGTLAPPTNAISEVEVITGGFNAEYGDALSGIVNIVTKEGGQRHTGRLMYLTDDFGSGGFKSNTGNGTGLRTLSQNTDRFEISLGGPEPITNMLLPAFGLRLPELTYFISGTGYSSNTTTAFDVPYYAPTGEDRSDEVRQINLLGLNLINLGMPNRMDNLYNALANLSVRFNSRMKLTYSYQYNRSWYDEYNHAFSNLPENFWQREEHSYRHALKWTHTINSRSFYDFSLSFSNQNYLLTPGGMLPPEVYALQQDITREHNTTLNYVDLDRDTFYDIGYPDRGTYHNRSTETIAGKLDLTSQLHRHHQLKGGLEIRTYKMVKGEIKYPGSYYAERDPALGGTPIDDGPWPALGVFRDFYTRTPFNAAIYAQDKIEYKELIVNVGLRFDLQAPGKQVEDEIGNASEIFGTKMKVHFNPRLGISHPITEHDLLYFQFGRFTQNVEYNFLFLQDTQSSAALKLYGNPNLGAEETTQYEVGVKHAFGDNLKMDVTAFFKDYSGLLNTETKGRDPFTYSVYVNRDYGSARGLELSFDKRYSHFTSAFFSYTLLYATGKSSSYRQGYDYGARGQDIPIQEWPLDWDVRHAFNFNFDFRIPRGEHPRVFGVPLPDDFGVNFVWRYESGRPYTPGGQAENQLTTTNSARYPYRTWIDVRANKDFRFWGMRNSVLMEIKNLTNRRNARAVDAETGEATGNLQPQDLSPAAFTPGRTLLLGLAVEW